MGSYDMQPERLASSTQQDGSEAYPIWQRDPYFLPFYG